MDKEGFAVVPCPNPFGESLSSIWVQVVSKPALTICTLLACQWSSQSCSYGFFKMVLTVAVTGVC